MVDRSKLGTLAVEEKRELLKSLLGMQAGSSERILPLSHGQEALWFLHQMAPTSSAYNFLYAARIQQALDVRVLRQACQALIDRHPLLRARFLLRDHKPVQQIEEEVPVDLPVTDASTWSEEQLLQEARRRADLPFDLEQAPCLRVELFRRGQADFVFLLTFHHIIADLWSADLLLQELRQLYNDLRADREDSLPAVGGKFADFIRWEVMQAFGERGRKAKEYWSTHLDGDLPVLDLPTDRPRPPVQTYRGTAYSWPVEPEVVRRIRSLAEQHRATPFMALLSVFQLLLHRLTGQEEVLVGAPVAIRERPEWERVVGYFLNQVTFRASFATERTFRQLLDETREQVFDALEHQTYPFGLVVKQRQVARDPARSPIFQAMFVWDKPRDLDAPGEPGDELRTEPMLLEQRGAPFDVTLIIFELGDRLVASFRYNTDLFDAATIERWAGHFNTLLEALTASPDALVSEAPLLSPAQMQQVLIDFNRTAAPYPQCCFHEVFEQQVEKAPSAPAIVFEDATLTYAQLNRRANQLARYLHSRGVRQGDTVVLDLPRSPALIVSILAVWKAGAAYLFLDPAYPDKRRERVLADAKPAAIIVGSAVAGLSLSQVALDRDGAEIEGQADTNLRLPLSPDDRAYLIYTSGSTGEAKGVVLRHRGLCSLWAAQRQAFAVEPSDRVLQFATFSFDASVFELSMALGSGAALVLASQGAVMPGLPLYETLRDRGITNVTLPPSVLAMIPAEPLPKLRTLVVAGEACSAELVDTWATGRKMFNAYGPTEVTVWATVEPCVPGQGAPTIGRPIGNARVYVLDRGLQPVPVGVSGELYVAGVGVALGYLNRPDLTAQRFLPNPFDTADEAVMYRTGDVVRWTADGKLVFLGRSDHQVKIRGHRIELDEIQELLRRHPAVADAVVLVRNNAAGEPSLAAYVVPRSSVDFSLADVRTHLRQHLPRYMIPAGVVPLESFPLGPTGKLDRNRLPDPSRNGSPAEVSAAPRTPLEHVLAEIWARVLKVDRVGIHDHFFDLGGASTQTLEVVELAREKGIQLTPEMLFRYQTVAELAAAASEGTGLSPAAAPAAPAEATVVRQPAAVQTPATMTGALVESIGIHLPEQKLTTDDVLKGCYKQIEFPLERLTGIRSRRVAGETEFSLDLAEKAAANCLRRAACAPEDIDLLICCNISRCDGPYKFSLEPSTAARIASRFGLVNALAFDVTNACAGTFTAVLVADTLIRHQVIRRAMIVSGEYITHLTRTAQQEIESFMDPRLPCLTLGDSGVAVLLGHSPDASVGFQEVELYTLGKYHNLCVAKLSSRPGSGPIMFTDSVTSTVVTIKQAVNHAVQVLKRRKWDFEQVKGLVIHQTSETTLDGAAREINTALGKQVVHRGNMLYNVAERGNTATNTHFLALYEAIQAGQLRPGDRVVFAVSGSGQTVGTALYTFDDLPERLRQPAAPLESRQPRPADELRYFACGKRVRIESLATLDRPTEEKPETVSMLRQVGEACLQQSGRPREEIDLVLHTGVYRSDFLAEPAVASIAAGELGINHDDKLLGEHRTLAFDVLNGSGGTLTACFLASQLIGRAFSRALVLASEIEYEREHWQGHEDRRMETASALVLEESAGSEGFAAFAFRAFPEHVEAVVSVTGVDDNRCAIFHQRDAELEDREVECAAAVIRELLQRQGLSFDQVWLAPPQRPGKLAARLAETLGIDSRRVLSLAVERDLFTSSLAYLLEKVRQQEELKVGMPVLFLEVTAGLQVWCGVYYLG